MSGIPRRADLDTSSRQVSITVSLDHDGQVPKVATERTTSRKREGAPRIPCISSTRVFETAPVSQACQAGGGDRTADIYSDRRVALTISICSGFHLTGRGPARSYGKHDGDTRHCGCACNACHPGVDRSGYRVTDLAPPREQVDGGGAMCGVGRPRRHDRCAHRSDCWRVRPMPPATPAGIPTRPQPTIPRRTRIMDSVRAFACSRPM